MQTVGIDLSSIRGNTWMAVVNWDGRRGVLTDLRMSVSDAQIVEMAMGNAIDKIGINAPLGGPETLLDLMRDPSAVTSKATLSAMDHVEYRLTDIRMNELAPDLPPLNVSRNGFSASAIRCAVLQWRLREAGVKVDRAGTSGPIVEVYPAASLYPWHLTFKGYKGRAHAQVLQQMVNQLGSPGGPSHWLELGPWRDDCAENHHAFDALIAALTARAAYVGRTHRPEDDRELAMGRIEGWIHIPTAASLPGLADDALPHIL